MLFRSVDKARPDSDVDIVVAFDGPATSKRYFGVQFFWKTNSAILLTWLRRRQCGLSCGLTSNGRLLMSEREWRFYLDDMISFAENVLSYSDGFVCAMVGPR